MPRFVLGPAEATDPARVGGKAAALSRLQSVAVDVPPWVVVLPEALIHAAPADGAAEEIAEAVTRLGPGPFAVRSSAAGEDGVSDSHAGQLLSLLDVQAEGVFDAVRRVWASGFTESLAAYRAARGRDHGGAPAVIIQRMVRAKAAGVAFTTDPVTGARDRVLIEAVPGLADRLVAGEADGFRCRVDRSTLRIEIDPSSLAPGDPVPLSDAEIRATAAAALVAERLMGVPQDVEFALEDGRVWLVQARPITAIGAGTAAKPGAGGPAAALSADGARTAAIADDARLILDNSNIVESYPGLVAPLTFSFAAHVYAHVYRVLTALLGVPTERIRAHATVFDNLLARVRGRVYYNLLHWYRILALLPGFRLNRGYMETMMGVGEALPAEIADTLAPPRARGLARVGEVLRVARVAFGLLVQSIRLPRTIRAFQRRLDGVLAGDPAALNRMPLTALAAEYRRLEAALLERWDAPLVNDLVCMIAFGLSRKTLERWAGADGIALHGDALIGQSDIVSAEPAKLVREMGRRLREDPVLLAACREGEARVLEGDGWLAQSLRAYLARFGDRCAEELKLESTPLTDDPSPLLRAIAGAAEVEAAGPSQAPVDVDERLRALFRGRPLRRRVAGFLLAWSRRRVRDRENLRFERTRLFGRVRRIFRAIGGQLAAHGTLDQPDDVFLLAVDEVLGAIEGSWVSEDLRGLAALRGREMARFAALPDLPERLDLRGAAAVSGLGDAPAGAGTPAGASEDVVRTGLACCAGVARGMAQVVTDPRTQSVARGEILVARHTDPGWIALFASAAAVVVERGSLLSHSAIVARELGIPCVVGLKGATAWLATGDQVEVDGGKGRVARLRGSGGAEQRVA